MAQGQRNVSVVFDVEPKLVYPDWSHVHVIRMNLEIMVILGILVCFLYQLRKLVNKFYRWANPPAAGVDNLDGTSGHQVRNLNPSTPEPETNAVQPRHKDASTQTQLSPNAANDGNVADAEAKKKLEDTAADTNSQVVSLQQKCLEYLKQLVERTPELTASQALVRQEQATVLLRTRERDVLETQRQDIQDALDARTRERDGLKT